MHKTPIADKTMNLATIQSALQEQQVDGWLFYDHHNRDPLAYSILGLTGGHVTRRWYYFIPAHGEPRKLVHRIESGRLDPLPGAKTEYSSWQELESRLESLLTGATRIAMQYSPRNAIMYISMVDAGTIELVRSFKKEIISSADLVSRFEAVLTEAQIATHYQAQRKLDAVLQSGWREIGNRVRANSPDAHEHAIAQYLLTALEREGLITEFGPNVSAGPNSADSHYEPTAASSRPIRRGDFLLIDIWAKLANDPHAVWYDITWTGVIDRDPTPREQLIFETARNARDAAIAAVEQAFAANTPIAGYQADDASRAIIRAAGFAPQFTHRTGHNIGIVLHGNGANLDNLETHDTRLILPNTCFSVEPGIYFPSAYSGDPNALGIRSEVNMITHPGKAEVTGPRQTELVRI